MCDNICGFSYVVSMGLGFVVCMCSSVWPLNKPAASLSLCPCLVCLLDSLLDRYELPLWLNYIYLPMKRLLVVYLAYYCKQTVCQTHVQPTAFVLLLMYSIYTHLCSPPAILPDMLICELLPAILSDSGSASVFESRSDFKTEQSVCGLATESSVLRESNEVVDH